ncbi:MAG: hypothetical protein A2928_02000 [Candidatus Taylorbacteria bacterium RIFCSPLOWO2_01_FULL_45_15b]|uniref:HD/PDEase domain-containing protein n=1 Tax=Candidatus Taylorbacteria bacterium RIFCSPLOWO2_01_FULL_45_15b TaxID=1802319 RepID=A0A1G2NCA6_9BACT|nr:MAG: hypothetical protein A2928_02000 [Candidatus Taylorbacteria bacterium RIFCSPLOWO2_01_FULL_45_15b]
MSFVIFSEKIKKALRFSIKTHEVYQKQKRKGKDIPYITHPLIVGIILSRAEASEDVIIAGILHDTIEDCCPEKRVTYKMIADRFGERVAMLVDSVTEKNFAVSWDQRKKEAVEHIATYSHESILVKSADLISNTSDILEDYADEGAKTFERFKIDARKIVGHYIAAIKATIERWSKNPFVDDLKINLAKLSVVAKELSRSERAGISEK